jgi:hypothetical protein
MRLLLGFKALDRDKSPYVGIDFQRDFDLSHSPSSHDLLLSVVSRPELY